LKCDLVNTGACLALLYSHAAWGAPPQPGSPEAVVSKAMDAVHHGRIDEFASARDPDSLEEFRAAVVETIDEGVKRVGEAKLLESFPWVKTINGLKALDAPRLFAGVIRRKASDPSMKKALADNKIDVFGPAVAHSRVANADSERLADADTERRRDGNEGRGNSFDFVR
jgi:hypothetical protein